MSIKYILLISILSYSLCGRMRMPQPPPTNEEKNRNTEETIENASMRDNIEMPYPEDSNNNVETVQNGNIDNNIEVSKEDF